MPSSDDPILIDSRSGEGLVSEEYRSGFIGILGRPNVGKSTLLNQIIGENIAAVSPKAQTTRKRFRAILSNQFANGSGYQMVFVDTPGLHVPPTGKFLNEYCVSEAVDALEGVNCLLYIIDGSREFTPDKPGSDEEFVIQVLRKVWEREQVPVFVAINKVDKQTRAIDQEKLLAALQGIPVAIILPLVAKFGKGIPQLVDGLLTVMPEHPPYFPTDIISDEKMRKIAGELIQEQLFHHLGEELPYECAVAVEEYIEPAPNSNRKTEIHAAVHVNRKSQRAMVIGRAGEKIKSIGKSARASLEQLLGESIVLKLRVVDNPGWVRDRERMNRLGYAISGQEAEQKFY